MNIKSVLIIIDEENPANPPWVVVYDVNGETVATVPPVDVLDEMVGDGWTVRAIGSFQIGNNIYQNIILEPNIF